MNCIHAIVCLLNLEVDCGRDRVRRCRPLTPIKIVVPEIVLSSKNLNSSSRMANWILVSISINFML